MRARGLCYVCREQGHLANDCPKRQTVRMERKLSEKTPTKAITINYAALNDLQQNKDNERIIDIELVQPGGAHTVSMNHCMLLADIEDPSEESESENEEASIHNSESTESEYEDEYPELFDFKTIKELFGIERLDLLSATIRADTTVPVQHELIFRPTDSYVKYIESKPPVIVTHRVSKDTDMISMAAAQMLQAGTPYPFNRKNPRNLKHKRNDSPRFHVMRVSNDYFIVEDWWDEGIYELRTELMHAPGFDIRTWYALARQARYSSRTIEITSEGFEYENFFIPEWFDLPPGAYDRSAHRQEMTENEFLIRFTIALLVREYLEQTTQRERRINNVDDMDTVRSHAVTVLNGALGSNAIPVLERTSAYAKDFKRKVPSPMIVVVHVNGSPARALIDSGSCADFLSTKFADQIGVRRMPLAKPLSVQLATQGSRSKITYCTSARLEFGTIDCDRHFDIMNLDNYDVILGTPFLYQHQVSIGFNDARIWIESPAPLPLEGEQVEVLSSRVMDTYEYEIEKCRKEIREYASDLFKDASQTPLPPLRAINHRIPLIDENKQYKFRRSTCPDALREQWQQKRKDYIRSGRWRVVTGSNAMPMLLLQKPHKNREDPIRLRTVIDLRERNANTKKLSSPLPDIESVLRRVASKKFRSLIDGKDAYEQIRIVPEHVPRTIFNTPDGTMVSEVMQLGDCNSGATYQVLMNHIFQPYLGDWMDIYLDDLVIYSDSVEDHIRHLKTVIDILRREQFYLSEHKMQLFQSELKILGHIVDDNGIRMDPHKVDSIRNWKVPNSKDSLRRFLGAVGYLASNIPQLRIPMAVLTKISGETAHFRWFFTEQRAFQQITKLVHDFRNHHRTVLQYGKGAPPINIITDASHTGVGGIISQGKDWQNARIAAFYSAKMNSAQQNYPVHDKELLAGVETMLRHKNLLQGTHFRWFTDHKPLVHLLSQPNLSGRQARWIEKISDFDFEVIYVAGTENILADALSRIYADDLPGTVRARSEYVQEPDTDGVSEPRPTARIITAPLLINLASLPENSSIPLNTAQNGMHVSHSAERPTKLKLTFKRGEQAQTAFEHPKDSGATTTKARKVILRVRQPDAQNSEENARQDRHEADLPKNPGHPSLESIVDQQRQETDNPPKLADESQELVPNTETPEKSDPPMPIPPSDSQELTQMIQPQLTDIISQAVPQLQFPQCLKHRYNEDDFFKLILEQPSHYKNFYVENGLVFRREGVRYLLCIPKILINGRSAREIVIEHAHSILAHLGARKTLLYLRDQVWWKNMINDINSYCDSCHTCKVSKPNHQRPFGLLNPLNIPTRPWQTIGMDFVGPFPESKNRLSSFDMICTIVCLLTGMVHLVPCKQTYRAKEFAELIFENVYKLHGLPEAIVSDRGSIFTSAMWRHLNKLLNIRLKLSSAYHPQTDGSTERMNKTISQMLRQCVSPNQKDWVIKLPIIEFAINSARSETTGYAPFFLNYGRMPRSMIWNDPGKDEYPGVRSFAQKLKDAIMSAHDSILQARVKQTRQANRHRKASPFEIGDLVYISTKNMNLPKQRARKLVPKFVGPYKIVRIAGNDAYEIDLPRELKTKGIHPVFYASLLRVHVPNDDRLFPGREASQVTGLGDESNEWAVDSIEAHYGKGTDSLFKVVWKAGDHTWLPYEKIKHLEALETYLELLGTDSVENLPAGSEDPETDDPQITVNGMFLQHTAFLVLQCVNNVHKRSDSHKGTPKKFRSCRLALSMSQLPANDALESFFLKDGYGRTSNYPEEPPQYLVGPGIVIDSINQSWMTFDSGTKTAYLFPPEELRRVAEFSNHIEHDTIPPNVKMPERYLILHRLYNFHVPDGHHLAPLPPFVNRRRAERMQQASEDFVLRKNQAANIGLPVFHTKLRYEYSPEYLPTGAQAYAERVENGHPKRGRDARAAQFYARNRKRARLESDDSTSSSSSVIGVTQAMGFKPRLPQQTTRSQTPVPVGTESIDDSLTAQGVMVAKEKGVTEEEAPKNTGVLHHTVTAVVPSSDNFAEVSATIPHDADTAMTHA